MHLITRDVGVYYSGLRPESSGRLSISPEEVAKVIDDVYRCESYPSSNVCIV
jgi:hypothetical protein